MSDNTALARRDGVNLDTGEVLPIVRDFSMTEYLGSISGPKAFAAQNSLAAAYDAACAELIGPNDIQKADGRSFKKKSAWRKLARHFNISVVIVKVDREILDNDESDFLAAVVARAVAPWGQSYEEVGACCTDEATGKRVISMADAIATASTRASNRAVSNLIAMGEVSAEEIGERRPQATSKAWAKGTPVLPFGKNKGTPLADMETERLVNARAWAAEHNKYQAFQNDATDELERRRTAEQDDEPPQRVTVEESGGTGLDNTDDLPF